MNKDNLLYRLHQLHLIYLGCLPAVATWIAISSSPPRFPILIFLGGTALVGVYLAVVGSYTPPSTSISFALFTLVDGPVIAAIGNQELSAILLDAFLIDSITIWLAIALVATTTDRPSPDQQIATYGLTLVAISTIALLFWSHITTNLFGQGTIWWLLIGIIEGLVTRYIAFEKEAVMQHHDFTAFYIVIFIWVWIIAMMGGNIAATWPTG